MHRLLILLLACLFVGAPALLRAQVPHEIVYPAFDPHKVKITQNTEMMCNNAGTVTFGPFDTESNDTLLPTIFLCFGDTFFVNHAGNADLSGDPNPATPAGIAYGFYTCPPLIMGDNLQAIIGSALPPIPPDACLLNTPPSANGMYQTQAVPNGGTTTFFNNGTLQTLFNAGLPLSLYFAPITVDDVSNNGYEAVGGNPPGPCVNVNTTAAFEVVYLNEITATGIDNNFGNDCLGKFTIRGGFPQYDNNAVFTITVTLASNPAVQAVIHTPALSMFHGSNIIFSAPQPGLYDIVVEDGKSCPFSFQMDMTACDPTDNITFGFPQASVPPGNSICVPVTVENFEIISGNFSMSWDETVLQYTSIINTNPILDPFTTTTILNENEVANGQLGLSMADDMAGTILSLPDGAVLFEICFDAIGQLGDCSPLNIEGNPTGIAVEDEMGQLLALTVDTGQVCIAFTPLALDFEIIDSTCLNQGTLVVTPTGGVPGYEITVSVTGGPTYNATIGSGNFIVPAPVGNTNNTPVDITVCVEDNNGNGATQCTTFTVNIQRRVEAQINFTQPPLCNGQATGVIDGLALLAGSIVPNPGSNYTFAWSNGGVGPTLNGVIAGPYSLTVTNVTTMCSGVASGSLPQPAPISAQMVTLVDASCSGVCNGTITYEAEGGTPFAGGGYGYSWFYNTGNTPAGAGGPDNPIVLNAACGGDYTITITDANGCTAVDSSITLDNTRELGLNNAVTGVLCNGGNTGAITATVTESTPSGNTYTFTWIPGGFTQTGVPPLGSTYSNLPAGTYDVVAVDAQGCSITESIIVGQPELLFLDTTGLVNPICAQVNSGSIGVQAFGGTGLNSYTYTWTPTAPPGVTNQLNNIPPGDYSVTVTDGNGCVDSLVFNLPVPTPPTVTASITQAGCGSDGALTANSPTGTTIIWFDILGNVIDTAQTITGLSGGLYVVNVYDNGGCFTADTFAIDTVAALTISDTTLIEPTCFGFTDGQIAIGMSGGNPPYVNYTWDPAQNNSPVIFTLAAGTYTVTVEDNIGCTTVGTFQLGQPPEIIIAFDPTANSRVSCFEIIPCDGEAIPLVAFSTGPGDFTFAWEDGSSDSVRVDLCAGFNSVTVTNANNPVCFSIDSVEITTPDEIALGSLVTTETLCFGDSTGTATITPTGGNGAPYTVVWNTGDSTVNVTGLAAGVYTVTITDADGCTNSIDTITIDQPGEIILSLDPVQTQDPKCFGEAQGSVGVLVTGGVPQFTYAWEDEDMIAVGSGQVEEQLVAGTYFVTATDANGCTATQSVTLQDPPPVQGLFEPITPLTCFGDETILQIDTIFGGSGGPYKFSVDFGAVLDPNFPVSIGGGLHFITYYDGQDCSLDDSLFVAEPSPITVTFDPDEIEVELGATADLEPIITGAAVIADFEWTNPTLLLNPDTLDATAYTFNTTTYTLTVIDSFGCSGSGSVLVNIDPNRNVFVPNIFAPGNSTGLNDFFNVYVGLGVELVNFMRVYDRWGELMYERERFLPNGDNLAEGWDGRFKGDFVNPGVFVYIVEVKFLDGRVLLYRGDVTVTR